MDVIDRSLALSPRDAGPVILREQQPGDLGWIVQRHGELYASEYGWGMAFESLVAGIVASFGEHHDPARERLWIAELDGERVGSIMLVTSPEDSAVAKLRLLLVDPSTRGRGVGKLLVATCTAFAREAGYRKITLWTHDVLVAARGIYARSGFRLVDAVPSNEFGTPTMSETWELDL
jgi:GNAT superfamily N-acetyltransferase